MQPVADGRAHGAGSEPARYRCSSPSLRHRAWAPYSHRESDSARSETRGLCVPPEQAIGQALAAALAVEQLTAGLSTEHVTTMEREEGPRLVDRSIHRTEHLDEIEAVLG